MVITVYVTCCGGDKAVAAVQEAVRQAGVEAQVEVVKDLAEIVRAGVMSPPAIKVDGRLVASGRVPKVADLVGFLKPGAASSRA